MWKFLLLQHFLCVLSLRTELNDLLSTTDQVFEDYHQTENSGLSPEALKMMLKRTYNLKDVHSVHKRSSERDEMLIQDPHGVYLLTSIKDVNKIPVKFPNDINILSCHNLLYIAALESNGNNPEKQLANNLVLFHYSSIQGIREMGRVPVLGGVKIAIHSFQNTTYIVIAEHEAKEDPDLYQGSTVYRIVERSERVFLEKIQILNVIQPNDVKFWEHQDQLYLAIGTNMGNNSERTGTLIYRWLGHHFDCLQVIPSKNVKSLTPFIIGSFMYLAVGNFKDENGNFDINSEIFQFNLQEMRFKPFQKVKTHGARDVSYFYFEEAESKEREHFLIVANSLGKNPDGSLTSLKESVVYKFSDNYFIPFQSFRLHGATQWLPIKSPNKEFLLLGSYANGVVGYQYDGWRFTQVPLEFGQSAFGSNIQSMRMFYYFGDLFLTISDKSSYGNVNLWKLSFVNKNELQKHYGELESWCNEMTGNMTEDDFNVAVNKFNFGFDDKNSEYAERGLKIENQKAEDFDQEILRKLEMLNEKTRNMERLLQEAKESWENLHDQSELPIDLSSEEIASLEVNCKKRNCCSFKKVKILKLNGENFTEFLENVVPLSEDLESSVLEFEHVVLENGLSSPLVNGHPSETLIDLSSDTFLNAELIVNGTLFVNNDLNVNGLFDGLRPDENHMLLARGFQNIREDLTLNKLRVKNLKLFGLLNRKPIENLIRSHPPNLSTEFRELNVNNIFVRGLINGYKPKEVIEDTLKKSGDQTLTGDVNITSLEASEVITESDQISNISISSILDQLELRSCGSDPNFLEQASYKRSVSTESESGNSKYADEYVVIVEGFLRAKDLCDETNSASLLHIVQNGLKLNESVIDARFHFSNIEADDIHVDFMNQVPLSSWILSSEGDQQVHGKKRFLDRVHIREEAIVKKLNDIRLEKEGLKGNQINTVDLKFNNFQCREITANVLHLGNNTFDNKNRLIIKGSISADEIQVENLTLTGEIDSVSWENILEDSVYEKDLVTGRKTIKGAMKVDNLNMTGRINELLFEEFVALSSTDANKIVLDRNVTLSKPLNVDELHFEGLLDSVLKPNFEREWLLLDETQIITGPVTLENIHMKSGSNLMNETINNISLRKLFSKSIKINEDTKLKHLFSLGKMQAGRIDVGHTFSGADFKESIVRSRSKSPQILTGNLFFGRGLTVNGSLTIEGHLSGLNLTQLCGLMPSEKINLVVGVLTMTAAEKVVETSTDMFNLKTRCYNQGFGGFSGSVHLKREPVVVSRVNDVDLTEKVQEIWMKNENTSLRVEKATFGDVDFENRTVLLGSFNGVNLTHLSQFYLSKTHPRVVSGDFTFENLVIRKWCRMREARVGGEVNGIDLKPWVGTVLLQNDDQIIEENLQFEKFETSNLNLEGTLNRLDLAKDVLRLDVENATVEGEKTFTSINVLNLTLAEGRRLQGVDIDSWRELAVRTEGEFLLKGDIVLSSATFNGPFRVIDKVNNISFDSRHLLTTTGNQVVTAEKRFECSDNPLRIATLETSGRIDGTDLDELIKNQAFADGDLSFKEGKVFSRGLQADSMEVDGLFQGVNVSRMCHDAFNPVDLDDEKGELRSLLDQTESLVRVVKGRTFFFDHFELIQTLKPNILAAVPTLDHEGKHSIAVFTSNTMKQYDWDDYAESFVDGGEELILTRNVTFVGSEVFENGSLLYIETGNSVKIFDPKLLKEIDAINTSCFASFKLSALNKSCIFIGQKWNSSRILCNSYLLNDLQTYQWLESKGSVQVATITVDEETFIAVINKEVVFDKIENTLSIYRFDPKLQHFYLSHTLAEVNPVALAMISYKNEHYLVSAGGHLPESVHNSVLSIFRFNKRHRVFVRAQSIQVDTPVDVRLDVLPSSQLALYVLTSNPTKPFLAFLYRGVAGFVKETTGLSLYSGSRLHSFTDFGGRHFVIIGGFGRGQILKAGFKG